ncbi:hypothetical protein ACMWH1_13555, partial [Klebsiella pneumoniae]
MIRLYPEQLRAGQKGHRLAQ